MSSAATILRMNTERADRVRTEWKIVSPELATRWLEGNTHNRGVRDSVVQRYAADMKAGRWKQSHQGIAFDEEGTLIDGQHRLFAIIEAKTSILMQVTYGLPMSTQAVVDDGLKRSVVDVLKVQDEKLAGMSNLHAAIADRMRRGLSEADGTRNMTRQEQGAFLVRNWEAISFVVSQFPMVKRVRGVTSAAPLAAIARAFYHEDRALLIRFCKVLSEGISEDQRDYCVIKLRNYMLTRKLTAGSNASREAYAKTERALKAFCRNEQIARQLVPVTDELYPIPTLAKNGK